MITNIKISLKSGKELMYRNAQAREGHGYLIIYRKAEDDDSTATILARLDSQEISTWRMEVAKAA